MLIPRPDTLLPKARRQSSGELLSAEIVQRLSQAYGLEFRRQWQVSRRDQVHDTGTYLFETAAGKIILREHVRNVDRNRLLYEHSLLAYLHAQQLPVAPPRFTRDGETFVEIDQKYYTFFDFIAGYQLHNYHALRQEKLRHLRQAAEALGRFHRVTTDFTPAGNRAWRNDAETKVKFAAYREQTAPAATGSDFNRFFNAHHGFLNATLAAVNESLTAIPYGGTLPRGIIHEDYGPYNLIFRHGKLSGILDLMDAHQDWKAKDVIFALFIFSLTRKGYYDKELAKTFLESYQRFGELTPEEIDAMPALFCYKRLNELPFYLTAIQQESGEAMKYENMFTNFVEEIKWHQQNQDGLRAQLRSHLKKTRHEAKAAPAAGERTTPLKILTIATVFPYPPDNGSKIPTYHRLRWLAERNDVTLLCICSEEVKPEHIAEVEKVCTLKLFKIPPLRKPETAAGKMAGLVRSLWKREPYYLIEHVSSEAQSWLCENVAAQGFDVVEAADDHASIYLRPEWPSLKVMVVHSVGDTSFRKQMAVEKNLASRLKTFGYWWVWRNREKKFGKTADLVATLTGANAQELLALNPRTPAKNCLTNGVDLEFFFFEPPKEKATTICFVGRMDYPPNIDAVVHFAREVLPLVRRDRPEVKFQIIGAKATAEVRALANDPAVEVIGYVDDIRPYLRNAGIAAIPTRMGGGILNKILEALALGVPVVACTVSIEGLKVQNGRELLIGDTSAELAGATLRLLNDSALRRELARHGRQYVERHHQWQNIIATYEKELRLRLNSPLHIAGGKSEMSFSTSNRIAYKTSDVVAAYVQDSALLPPEKTIYNLLRERLAGMKMLDLGVGGGRTALHFANLVNEYVGVDYAEEMIVACRKRFAGYPAHVSFAVCDAREMAQFEDDVFDFILFSYNGLDYIPHHDRLKALEEIHRVGKAGGYFCFSTHNLQSLPQLFELKHWLAQNPNKKNRRTLKNILNWLLLNHYYNRGLNRKAALQAPHAVINDGLHDFSMQAYYIKPAEQIKQLQAHFGDVRVFSPSGEEIKSERALAATEDCWLYFLCEIK